MSGSWASTMSRLARRMPLVKTFDVRQVADSESERLNGRLAMMYKYLMWDGMFRNPVSSVFRS